MMIWWNNQIEALEKGVGIFLVLQQFGFFIHIFMPYPLHFVFVSEQSEQKLKKRMDTCFHCSNFEAIRGSYASD
ncbi:MAG: hypothetical protein DU489_03120 [Nitrosomonas sp.]